MPLVVLEVAGTLTPVVLRRALLKQQVSDRDLCAVRTHGGHHGFGLLGFQNLVVVGEHEQLRAGVVGVPKRGLTGVLGRRWFPLLFASNRKRNDRNAENYRY